MKIALKANEKGLIICITCFISCIPSLNHDAIGVIFIKDSLLSFYELQTY